MYDLNHTFTNAATGHKDWTAEKIKALRRQLDDDLAVARLCHAIKVVAALQVLQDAPPKFTLHEEPKDHASLHMHFHM